MTFGDVFQAGELHYQVSSTQSAYSTNANMRTFGTLFVELQSHSGVEQLTGDEAVVDTHNNRAVSLIA